MASEQEKLSEIAIANSSLKVKAKAELAEEIKAELEEADPEDVDITEL